MISKEKVLRTKRFGEYEKRISINLKVTEEVSKYLKDNNISPTLLFVEAVKELRENETQ